MKLSPRKNPLVFKYVVTNLTRLSPKKNPLVFTYVVTNLMRLSPRKNPLVLTNVVTNFHEVITKEEPTGINKRCHQFPWGYQQGRTHWYSQTLSQISTRLSPRKNPLVFTNVVTNLMRLFPRKNPLVFTNVVTNFHEVITMEEPTGGGGGGVDPIPCVSTHKISDPRSGPAQLLPPHVKQRSYPHGVRPQIPDR